MYINKSELSSSLTDNDLRYFTSLESVINSVDVKATIDISRKQGGYNIKISPSGSQNLNIIMSEILKLHNLLGLQINLSKSIKSSGKIFYNISF